MLRVFDCRLKSVSIEYPSVPQGPSQFNTSFPHKNHTFSMPKIPQFNTKNPSVQHRNPLSSTPKPLTLTHPSVPLQKPPVQHSFCQRGVLNPWGVFGMKLRGREGTEGCVELRGFRCWTEGFSVWNWGLCWTEGFRVLKSSGPFVRNWNVELRGCGTEGDPFQLPFSKKTSASGPVTSRIFRVQHNHQPNLKPKPTLA